MYLHMKKKKKHEKGKRNPSLGLHPSDPAGFGSQPFPGAFSALPTFLVPVTFCKCGMDPGEFQDLLTRNGTS